MPKELQAVKEENLKNMQIDDFKVFWSEKMHDADTKF